MEGKVSSINKSNKFIAISCIATAAVLKDSLIHFVSQNLLPWLASLEKYKYCLKLVKGLSTRKFMPAC